MNRTVFRPFTQDLHPGGRAFWLYDKNALHLQAMFVLVKCGVINGCYTFVEWMPKHKANKINGRDLEYSNQT